MSNQHKEDNVFYESLPATSVRPSGLSVPDAEWADRVVESAIGTIRRTAPFFADVLSYTGALLEDIRRIFGRLAHRLITRPARTLYLSLAVIGTSAGAAVAVLIASATMASYSGDLANPSYLLNKKNVGTTIVDRNGEVLYQAYGAANRQVVGLETLPKDIQNATLAAEDPDFYRHPGFSWRATARALYTNVTNGQNLQGGSTITQQLVKNTLLTSDKSYLRKYQEIILAYQLERKYSKDEILQMYLNEVYYGQGSHGIEAAAKTYFHKPAAQLTLAESALLAGLPLGPSRFDPNLDPELAKARRGYILEKMQAHGFISSEQAKSAGAEPIQAHPQKIAIRAPHFVFYVLSQLRQQYGNELVERGGITVHTTLDLKKQELGQKLVTDQVNKLEAAHRLTNGAMAAVDPKTGEILTMVGSRDYYYPGFGALNVTTARRQPGSSFKPFVYITAFKKGWHSATTVEDKPISLTQYDGSAWRPTNYDQKFRGEVTLRRALQNSLNVPSVRVQQHAGLADSVQTASDLGITGLNDPGQYGLSFVLGTAEVMPLDMAVAYATIANGGVKVTPKSVTKVLNKFGQDITKKPKDEQRQVLDPRIAYMITHILSDNNARAELFGTNSPLRLSRPAAAKTGTTEDFRDDWTVGFVPQLSVAVWMGNNDNTPIRGVTGITGAAPIWNGYMQQVLAGVPVEEFKRPDGVDIRIVCGITEVMLAGQTPSRRCSAPKPAEPKKEEAKPAEPPNKEKKD